MKLSRLVHWMASMPYSGCILFSAVGDWGKSPCRRGLFFASGDSFNFDIFGRQCHGSSPWDGVDAIVCACAAVMNLQTIVSRVNDARLPIVINVGTIQGGDRSNITPGHVAITGSTRSFDEGVRKQLPDWIEQSSKGRVIPIAVPIHMNIFHSWGRSSIRPI